VITILQHWQTVVVGMLAAGAAVFLLRRVISAFQAPAKGSCDKCSPAEKKA
jgi:hypothetical protein